MTATTDATAAPAAGPGTSQAQPGSPVAAVSNARWAALALLGALVALCVAWETWLAPTGRGTLAIKALPLLAAVPGLWRHRLYTYRWLSLLVWLYVLEGLVRATSEHGPGAWLAGAEVALAAALFTVVTFYIRRRLAAGSTTASSA